MTNNIINLSPNVSLKYEDLVKINGSNIYKYIATIKDNDASKNYNVFLEREIFIDNINKEKLEALILNKISDNTTDIYFSNEEIDSIFISGRNTLNLSNGNDNFSDTKTNDNNSNNDKNNSRSSNGNAYQLNDLDLFGDAQKELDLLSSSLSGGLLSCHDKINALADAIPSKFSYIGSNAKSAVKMFDSSKVTSEINNFKSAISEIYKSLNDALYGDKFLSQLLDSEYLESILANLTKEEREKAEKEIRDRIKNIDRTSHNDFMFEIDAILLEYNPNVSEEDKKLTIEKAKENDISINESLQVTGYTNATIGGFAETLKGLDGVEDLPDLNKNEVWQDLFDLGILEAPEFTTFTTASGLDIKITPQNAGENYSGPTLKGQILTDVIFDMRDEYYSTIEGQDALYNACLMQSGATFDAAIGTTLYLQKCISEGKNDWIKDELKHVPGMLEEINNNFGKKREISKEEKKYIEQYKKAYNGALPYNYYKDNSGNYYTYDVSNDIAQKELEYLDFHSNEFNGNFGDNKIYTAFSDVGHVSAVERNYRGAYIETKTSVYLKEMGKTADDISALEEARQMATNDYEVLNNGVKDSKRRQELIAKGDMSFEDIVNYVNSTEGQKLDDYLNIEKAKENQDAINQNREKIEGTMYNFDLAEDATFNTVLIESLGVGGIQLAAGVGKFLESAGYDSIQMLLNSDLVLRTQVDFEGETSLLDKFINYFSSKKEFNNYKDETWNNYYKSDLYNYQYNEYFNTVSEGEIKAYFDKHYADLNSNSYIGPDGKQYFSYADIPLNVRQSVIPDLFKTSKINEWSLNDSSSSNMYLSSFNEGIRNGGDFSKFYNLDSETKEIALKQIETMEKVSVDMAGNFFKENIYDKDWYKTMEDYSIVKKDNILGVAVNQVGNMAIPILSSIYAPQIIGAISPTLSTAALGTIGSTASSSLLFASAFGGASEEAINSGASFNEALSYATLSATTEILIEKVFSGIQGFGEGWADELIEWLPNKIISKVGLEDNLLVQTIKSLIAGGIGEGIEEVATDLVTPMWQSFTYMNDKNYIDIVTENVSFESLAQTFLVSFLSSMVFGTGEIVQKTNQFNKQINNITSEIGDLPGFKEQANKILANIIGYDGSFLTTDIINDIIEKNAGELLANNKETNELDQKLKELEQKLRETQVVIENNGVTTNVSKELLLNISEIGGFTDKYQIVDNKIVFDNENIQTKFVNTVYEMAKNNLKQELELNKNVVTNLYSNNKLNLAIQTLKNIGDKSNLSKVFGNIKLMIEENEYVIPQSVVQEITSKYTVNENNELLFTDENMSIDKFVSELHTKAIEKLKETNVSIEEQIKEIADAQKNQTTDVFNNAVAIINGSNQTSVETKDISILEEIGLKEQGYEFVTNGKTDKVNIYIDSETDTKVLENKNVKNKIQEIIESKIKNNSNIKDVYVGKIELVNGQAQVTTNREQKAFVDSKTEDIVTTEREYVDINEHKFIKQEAFVTSDNKTEKVNVYIDAETNTKLLQDKNVKDKIYEIIVETKKQNNDSKDIYIGEILVDKKSNDVIVNQKNAILLAGMNIAIQNVVNNEVYTSKTSNTRVNKQENKKQEENTKEVNNKTNNTSGVFENIYAETSFLIQKYTKEMNKFIEDIRKNCQKFVLEHYKDIKNFESKYLQYKLEQRTKFNNKLNEIRKFIFSEQQKSIDSVNELIQKFKEKTDIRKKYENIREELVKKYKDELDNFISKTNEYFDKIISSIVIPINDSVINNILGTNKTNIVIDSAVSAKETLKLDLPNKLNGIETSKLLEYITNEDLLMDFANQKGTDINRINTISALKTIEKMQEYLGIKLSRNTSYMINTLYNECLNEIVVSSMKGKLPKAYYDFDSIYKTNHNLKKTIFEMESKGYKPLDIANALLSMSNITSNYKNSRYIYNEAYKYLIDKGYSNEKAADKIGELYEKLIKQKGYETIVTKDGLKIHIQNGINWNNQPYTIDYVTKQLLRLKNIYKTNVAVNVYVHDTFNSYDKYWEVKYNRNDFVSAATGGDGVINIYRNDHIEDSILPHEYAHLLDAQIMLDNRKIGRFAKTKEYLEAIKLDNMYPTEYAKTNSTEDLAESISLMIRKPEYFIKSFPNRYKVLSKYINIDGYNLGTQTFNSNIGNAIQTMISIYGDNAFNLIMDYINTGNSSLITEVNNARNIITNTSVDDLIEYINNSYGNKNNETYTPFYEEIIIEDVSNQKVVIPTHFEVKGETLLSDEIENVKVETSYIESLIKDNKKLLSDLRLTPAHLTPQIIKDAIIKYIDFAYENNINIELSENVKKYYETYKNALNNNKVILNETDIIINNKDGILISKNIFDKYMNGTMKEQVVFERLIDSIMSLETFEKNISNIEVLRDIYEILKDESLTKELSQHDNFKVITNVFSKLDMTKLSGPQYIYSLSNKSNETLSVYNLHDVIFNNESPIYMPTYIKHDIIYGRTKINDLIQMIEGKKETTISDAQFSIAINNLVSYLNENNIILEENLMNTLNKFINIDSNMIVANAKEVLNGVKPYIVPKQFKVGHKFVNTVKFMEILDDKASLVGIVKGELFHQAVDGIDMGEAVTNLFELSPQIALKYKDIPNLIESVENSFVWLNNNSYLILPKTINGIETENLFKVYNDSKELNKVINSLSLEEISQYKTSINEIIEIAKKQGFNENELETVTKLNESLNVKPAKRNVLSKLYDLFTKDEFSGGTFGTRQHAVADRLSKINLKYTYETLFNMEMSDEDFFKALGSGGITREEFNKALDKRFEKDNSILSRILNTNPDINIAYKQIKENIKLVQKNIEGLTESQAFAFLHYMESYSMDNDGICTYADIVNTILSNYIGKESKFKKDFGYPMYIKNEKGNKVLNSEMLLLDLYSIINRETLVKFKDNVAVFDENNKGYIHMHTLSSGLNQSALKDFFQFKSKQMNRNINLELTETFKFDNYKNAMHYESLLDEIGKNLEQGNVVTLSAFGFNLYERIDGYEIIGNKAIPITNKLKEKATNVGGHQMTIVALDDAGNIVVDSWGKKLIFNLKEELLRTGEERTTTKEDGTTKTETSRFIISAYKLEDSKVDNKDTVNENSTSSDVIRENYYDLSENKVTNIDESSKNSKQKIIKIIENIKYNQNIVLDIIAKNEYDGISAYEIITELRRKIDMQIIDITLSDEIKKSIFEYRVKYINEKIKNNAKDFFSNKFTKKELKKYRDLQRAIHYQVYYDEISTIDNKIKKLKDTIIEVSGDLISLSYNIKKKYNILSMTDAQAKEYIKNLISIQKQQITELNLKRENINRICEKDFYNNFYSEFYEKYSKIYKNIAREYDYTIGDSFLSRARYIFQQKYLYNNLSNSIGNYDAAYLIKNIGNEYISKNCLNLLEVIDNISNYIDYKTISIEKTTEINELIQQLRNNLKLHNIRISIQSNIINQISNQNQVETLIKTLNSINKFINIMISANNMLQDKINFTTVKEITIAKTISPSNFISQYKSKTNRLFDVTGEIDHDNIKIYDGDIDEFKLVRQFSKLLVKNVMKNNNKFLENWLGKMKESPVLTNYSKSSILNDIIDKITMQLVYPTIEYAGKDNSLIRGVSSDKTAGIFNYDKYKSYAHGARGTFVYNRVYSRKRYSNKQQDLISKTIQKGTSIDFSIGDGYVYSTAEKHLILIGDVYPDGIYGTHNMEYFNELVENSRDLDNNKRIKIIEKVEHPIYKGIFNVKYSVDGVTIRDPKTIYDPAIFSDEMILEYSHQAIENRECIGGNTYIGMSSNGMLFQMHYDGNVLTSIYPVFEPQSIPIQITIPITINKEIYYIPVKIDEATGQEEFRYGKSLINRVKKELMKLSDTEKENVLLRKNNIDLGEIIYNSKTGEIDTKATLDYLNDTYSTIPTSTLLEFIKLDVDSIGKVLLNNEKYNGYDSDTMLDAVSEIYNYSENNNIIININDNLKHFIKQYQIVYTESNIFPINLNYVLYNKHEIKFVNIAKLLNNPAIVQKYNLEERENILIGINLYGNYVLKNGTEKNYLIYLEQRERYLKLISRNIPQVDLSQNIYSSLYYMFWNSWYNGGRFGADQGSIKKMLYELDIKNLFKDLFFKETISNDNFLEDLNKIDVTEEELSQVFEDLYSNSKIESVVRLTNIIENSEIIKLVQKNFPGMNGIEAIRFLYLLETAEAGAHGICNYSTAVNMIFNKYNEKEEQFEFDFGYPMYSINEEGEKILNDKMLLVDMYSIINKDILVKAKDGKYEIATSSENYLNLSRHGKFDTEKLQKFINEKELDLVLNETFYCHSLFNPMWKEEIIAKLKESLEKGQYINVSADGFNILYKTGEIALENVSSHIMTVVGLTQDEKLIVDSWGMELLIDLETTIEHCGEMYFEGEIKHMKRLAISAYELNDASSNIENQINKNKTITQDLEIFDTPKEIDIVDVSQINTESDKGIGDLEPLIVDKSKQINVSDESLHSIEDNEINIPRPQIKGVKELSIMDNIKHTLVRINDKFTGFKVKINEQFNKIKINLLLGENDVLLNKEAYLKGESNPIIIPRKVDGVPVYTDLIYSFITGEYKLDMRPYSSIEEQIFLAKKFANYIYLNNIVLDDITMFKLNTLRNLKDGEIILNLQEFYDGESPNIISNSIIVDDKSYNVSEILYILNTDNEEYLRVLLSKATEGIIRENIFDVIDALYINYPSLKEKTLKNYEEIKIKYNNYIYIDRVGFVPKAFNGISAEVIDMILKKPLLLKEYTSEERTVMLNALDEYVNYCKENFLINYKEKVEIKDKIHELINREIPRVNFEENIYSELYYMFLNSNDNGGTFGTDQGVIRKMLKELGIKDSIKILFYNEVISDDNFLADLNDMNITEEKLNHAFNNLSLNPNKDDVVRLSNIINNNEVIKLVQKNFPGMNGIEAIRFLYLVETVEAGGKGICNYAVAVNMVFNKFIGKESEFEMTFGYPMYVVNKDGKKVLNDSMLLVDMYSIINNGNLVKKNLNGKFEIATSNKYYTYLLDFCQGGKFDLSNLKKFFDAKGIDIGIKETFYYNSENNVMWEEELILKIKDLLEKGEYINIVGFGFDLLNEDGSIFLEKCDGHVMTAVGLTTDGKVIVDSWGEKLFIDLENTLNNSKGLEIESYELTDASSNIENQINKNETLTKDLEIFDIPKEIDIVDVFPTNTESDKEIGDLEPLMVDKSKQINGSDGSLSNIEDNEINISRPQIQGVKELSIMDNIKHTLVRINDKFTGYKANKLNTESYYDRTTKSNNKLFKQKKINKTFRDFANKHLIDIENLINNGLLKNPKISEINSLITDNRVLTSMIDDRVSIADIIGTKKPIDLDKNFRLLFDESTSEFQTRDLGLLEYSNEQILNVLADSFINHPLVISEVDTGKYIVEDNGYHRYSILRLHYLNEYMKVKDNPALVAELNKKYRVPVKVYKLDTIKTYSTTLLKELGINVEVKTKGLTKQSTIFIDGKKVTMSDAELIEFTKEKINGDPNSVQIINKLLSKSESFKKFYNEYFVTDSNDYGIESDINNVTQVEVNNKTYQIDTIIDILENKYLEILKGKTIDGINSQNIFGIVNKVFENNPLIKSKYKNSYENIVDIFKNKYVHENGNIYPKTFNSIKTEDIIEVLKTPYKFQRYSKQKRNQINEAISRYIDYSITNNYDLTPKEYKGYLKVSTLMNRDVPYIKLNGEVKSSLLSEFRKNVSKGGTFGSKQSAIRLLLERNGSTSAINYLFNKDTIGAKFLEQIKDFTDEDFQDLLDNVVDETGKLDGLYNLYDEFEIFELMRNNFKGIEDFEIIKFLYLFESIEAGAKGICNYSAAVNMIFNKYLGNEAQFLADFKYPMYVIKNGKKVLNDTMLLVDMYSTINEDIFTKKVDDVVKVVATSNENYLKVTNAGGSFNFENLNEFLDKKGIKLDLNETFRFDSRYDTMWKEEILSNVKSSLEKGETVNLSAEGFDLYDKDGKTILAKDFEGHVMTVVGLTKNGNLIVDSHGREMIVNLDKCLEQAGKVYKDKNKKIQYRRIGITTYSFDSSVPSSNQNVELLNKNNNVLESDEGFLDVFKKPNDDVETFKDALSNNNISSLSESDIDTLVESIKKGKIKLKEYNLTSETIGILLEKVPINKIYPLSNVKAVKSFIDYFGKDTLVEFDKLNNNFLLGNNGENLYSLFDYYDLTIPKTEETDKLKELDNLITNAINSNKKTEYKAYTFNYSGLINTEYSKVHPELFLDESAPSDLKDAFYNGSVNSGNEYNPEWSKYLEGKCVKGIIHESLVGIEDVKVVENINKLGETSSKYNEGLESLANRVGLTIEEVEEILSSKLISLIETSEFGVRRTLKSLESILESGKMKNQFEVNHSSYGVSNTDMRMDMEENLFGIPRNMKYEDRPIYGMLLPQDLTSKYVQKGPGAYYSDGSGVIYIFDKSKIMDNTTLTLGDSLDQAGKICATNLSDPKYFGMFSEMLSTIKTKEDLLNFDFANLYEKSVLEVGNSAYYEFQLHGESSHTLDNLKEIVFLKMPEAKIIEKLEEMKIDWRVVDGSYSKKNSSPPIKKSESKVINESEDIDSYYSFGKSKHKPIRELKLYYGDAGKKVNSLFLKGKTTDQIMSELSIFEKQNFKKFLDETIEGQYLKKLSKDEIRAVTMYTNEHYGEINVTLRHNVGFNNIGGINTRMIINNIDSAISKYNGLEQPMKIYRAVNLKSFTHQNAVYEELFKGIKPYSLKEIYAVLKTLEGKEFSDLGYMSSSPAYATSFAKHLNYPIILEIAAKKGTKCAYINQISSFYNTENEILFARNTKLQIVEVLEPEEDVFGLTKIVVKCIVK